MQTPNCFSSFDNERYRFFLSVLQGHYLLGIAEGNKPFLKQMKKVSVDQDSKITWRVSFSGDIYYELASSFLYPMTDDILC